MDDDLGNGMDEGVLIAITSQWGWLGRSRGSLSTITENVEIRNSRSAQEACGGIAV